MCCVGSSDGGRGGGRGGGSIGGRGGAGQGGAGGGRGQQGVYSQAQAQMQQQGQGHQQQQQHQRARNAGGVDSHSPSANVPHMNFSGGSHIDTAPAPTPHSPARSNPPIGGAAPSPLPSASPV